MSDRLIGSYFSDLAKLGQAARATDRNGSEVEVDAVIDWFVAEARRRTAGQSKIVFIGNGGSAAIASHMAADYAKNGRLRAMAFNDAPALTCYSNDLGYEEVFSTPIALHAFAGDLLVAISSSGRSRNILNAVAAARERNMAILTLSGFGVDNPLRTLGDFNLYVPSDSYGYVEISHLALIHAALDRAMSAEQPV